MKFLSFLFFCYEIASVTIVARITLALFVASVYRNSLNIKLYHIFSSFQKLKKLSDCWVSTAPIARPLSMKWDGHRRQTNQHTNKGQTNSHSLFKQTHTDKRTDKQTEMRNYQDLMAFGVNLHCKQFTYTSFRYNIYQLLFLETLQSFS